MKPTGAEAEAPREKPQWIELKFDTDFLTWKDYDLFDRWIHQNETVKRRDLMEMLARCYVGEVPLETMPVNQIDAAAIELYLALHQQANPGEGEGNSSGG
jgi:hypothetical protein